MAPPVERDALDASVDAFLHHASVERGLSPRTIEAYGRDLARFVRELLAGGVRKPLDVEDEAERSKEQEKRKKSFQRARDHLQEAGLIDAHNEWFWPQT